MLANNISDSTPRNPETISQTIQLSLISCPTFTTFSIQNNTKFLTTYPKLSHKPKPTLIFDPNPALPDLTTIHASPSPTQWLVRFPRSSSLRSKSALFDRASDQ